MLKEMQNFIYEEEGMGTIEIAILIAALVALAIAFRKQLGQLWSKIKGSINDQAETAANPSSDIK